MAGHPDWQFPLDAAEGVPLGVSEPTWRSPGVWPTKDELTGMEFDPEDLETPRGHQNYPSAEEFAESIKETFREEAKLDMVLGPYSKGEAASTCRCAPEELCPGPMAAIDEGQDHLRRVQRGSERPHPGTHQGEDHGPDGPRRSPSSPLAPPCKRNPPRRPTGACEGHQMDCRQLELATTRSGMDPPEGRRHEGTQKDKGAP